MIAVEVVLHITPYQNPRAEIRFIQRTVGETCTHTHLHMVNNFNVYTIRDVFRFCFCQTCKTHTHICNVMYTTHTDAAYKRRQPWRITRGYKLPPNQATDNSAFLSFPCSFLGHVNKKKEFKVSEQMQRRVADLSPWEPIGC